MGDYTRPPDTVAYIKLLERRIRVLEGKAHIPTDFDFTGLATQIANDVVFGYISDLSGGPQIEEFSRSGTLVVEDFNMPLYVDTDCTVSNARIGVWGAPTGSSLVLDITKNGTTSLWSSPSSRPTITTGGFTAVSVPDNGSLVVGDFISPSLVQVGSTYGGYNLVVNVEFEAV